MSSSVMTCVAATIGHLESWQGAPVGHRREPRARMAYVSSRSPLCRVAGGREPAAAPQGVESATRSEYAISQGRGAFGARALNHLCRAVPRLDLEPQRQPLLSPCSAAGLAGAGIFGSREMRPKHGTPPCGGCTHPGCSCPAHCQRFGDRAVGDPHCRARFRSSGWSILLALDAQGLLQGHRSRARRRDRGHKSSGFHECVVVRPGLRGCRRLVLTHLSARPWTGKTRAVLAARHSDTQTLRRDPDTQTLRHSDSS